MPTPRSSGGRAVTSSPPKKILPAVGVSSPQIMFSVVDLPQPEGPSSPTSLPSGTVKVRSCTAVVSPLALRPRAGNRLVRPCNSIFIDPSPCKCVAGHAARCKRYTTIIADFGRYHKRKLRAKPPAALYADLAASRQAMRGMRLFLQFGCRTDTLLCPFGYTPVVSLRKGDPAARAAKAPAGKEHRECTHCRPPAGRLF